MGRRRDRGDVPARVRRANAVGAPGHRGYGVDRRREAAFGQRSVGSAGKDSDKLGDELVMKRFAIALLITLPLAAADTDSIDTVTRAVYDTISGPAGPRNWDRFRALFVEGARLINFRNTPQGPSLNVMTPGDFAKRA